MFAFILRYIPTNLKLKYKIFGAFLGLTVTLLLSIGFMYKPLINPERATLQLIQTDWDVRVSRFFSFWMVLGVGMLVFFLAHYPIGHAAYQKYGQGNECDYRRQSRRLSHRALPR